MDWQPFPPLSLISLEDRFTPKRTQESASSIRSQYQIGRCSRAVWCHSNHVRLWRISIAEWSRQASWILVFLRFQISLISKIHLIIFVMRTNFFCWSALIFEILNWRKDQRNLLNFFDGALSRQRFPLSGNCVASMSASQLSVRGAHRCERLLAVAKEGQLSRPSDLPKTKIYHCQKTKLVQIHAEKWSTKFLSSLYLQIGKPTPLKRSLPYLEFQPSRFIELLIAAYCDLWKDFAIIEFRERNWSVSFSKICDATLVTDDISPLRLRRHLSPRQR